MCYLRTVSYNFQQLKKKHIAFNLLCPWSEKGSYLIRFIFQSTLKKTNV